MHTKNLPYIFELTMIFSAAKTAFKNDYLLAFGSVH